MKTKKIFLTCILIIILTFISNNIVIAGDNNSDEYMNKATIKSRWELSLKTHYSGYESNEGDVGQTIAVKTGDGYDSDNQPGTNMSDEYDHIYCIRHEQSSADSLMLIKQFIKIRGDEATAYWLNGAKRITNNTWDYYEGTVVSDKVQSKYNIALSYLLSKYNYRKAYSMDSDNRFRQHAVNILLNVELKKTWGTKLLYDVFYDDGDYSSYSNWFYSESINRLTKNYNSECTPNISITSATTEITPEITGPYHFDFGVANEAAQWIYPIDANGNWIGGHYEGKKWENGRYVSTKWVNDNTISFYKDFKCTERYNSASDIKSGSYFYIKNTSGKKIKQVQIKAGSGYKNIQTDTKQIEYTSNLIGPISMNFQGRIGWIWPLDTNGKWLGENEFIVCDSNGNKITNGSIKNGTKFYIKNNSNKQIDKIHIKLSENTIRCAEIWWLERMDGQAAQRLIAVDTSTEKANSNIIIKTKLKAGELTINKKDSITNNNIVSQAEFKIRTSKGNWLIGTNGTYNYNNSDVNSATVYKTNDGTITLKNLLFDTYEIYEVTAPNGYLLSKQNGYDQTNNWTNCGKVTLNGDKTSIDIKNDLIISIEGYVWAEGRPDKPEDNGYNSKYDEGSDHRVSNITVKLFKKGNENPIATTTTNTNGEYKFTNIVKKKELENYYVWFDYGEGRYSYTIDSKTINKTIKDGNKYIPVAFLNEENGSKALAQKIPYEDTEVGSVAYTYSGDVQDMINTYGLAKIGTMDNEKFSLMNINLGIKEMLKPEFSIVKNIADVDIAINDYNYKYIYGGRDPKEEGFAENTREGPAVKWQNSNVNHAYSRPVYPSDVIYKNSDEKNKELDVKVTYRIDITNTTTYKVKELYVENKLILESILDDFDTNRYTLLDTNWDANNGTASMKSEYLEKIQKEINENKEKGLMSEATATAYITFSVNKNAIIDILNHPEGIIENNPTKVIVKGYHLYNRDDYMWNNLKTNSGQIKVNKEHQTESQTQAAEAPYLVFTIKPDGIIERTVSGKVFKDNVTVERGNSGEVVGDGKHQDNEKGIEGVKVELLGEDEDMNVTKLYQLYTENNVDKTRVIDAVVTTNQNGEYSLNGVVPGKYYLRFTYGNGTYKITDLTGTTIKEGTFETKVGENTIAAKDYKSTIMNSEIVSMIENKAELWYKENGFTDGKYSLALDNLEQRRNLNEAEANKELNDSEKIKEISADTSKISVTIENTKKDEAEETEETTNKQISATNSSGEQIKMLLNNQKKNIKFEFGGFYFGLIEMPKQELKIEKLIKNILIKNGQTNVFYNGNPEEVAKQGAGVVTVTDLDNAENGGSTYARAEMVEASISGSDFRIAYEVKITNVSDVNYYNEEYYKFGIIDKTKEVTATPITVYDYLDDTFKYEPEPLDPEKYYEKYKSDKDRIEEIDPNKKETIIVNGEKVEVQAYKLKGGANQDKWITLYTNKIKNRDSNHPTSDAVIIVASKLLSSSEYDWVVYNRAEIIDAKLSPSSLDTVNSDSEKERLLKTAAKEIHSNGMVEAMFTLTIPTGEDRYSTTLYAIAGIIALIVLSTGIVIIKKKIL